MNRLAVPNNLEASPWTLKSHDAARLFRMLETLYQAGVPIEVAIHSLASKPPFLRLASVTAHLRNGHPVHDAFRQAGLTDVVILSLLLLGEKTGRLDRSLASLADLYESRDRLNKELVSKLTYPLILSATCCVLVCVGPVYLARPMLHLLAQSGQEPSFFTSALQSFIDTVTGPAFTFGAVALAVFLVSWLPSRLRRGSLLPENLLMSIPVVGRLLQVLYSARLGRALLACHRAGYPLVSSIGLAAKCTGSETVRREARVVCRALINGEDEQCWKHFSSLHPVLLTSISLGYGTGTLEQVLSSFVTLLEESMRNQIDRLLSLLEPILLTLMGGVVGFCILATASPMLELLKGMAS